MSYAEFGLDAVKRTQDAGEHSTKFYDPWTWQHLGGRNFYLCFSNWVVSRQTIEAFQRQEPIEPLEGDSCIKCKAREIPLHYWIDGIEDRGTPIGICCDCVRWAADYLDKEPTVAPGTQLSLL